MWNSINDRYDSALAQASLEQSIILLQHYLRHIRHNEDYATACQFKSRIYQLEEYSRKVHKELKEKKDVLAPERD